MQGKGILPSQLPLPELPSNAQYTYHENMCYDWGTFGWALSSAVQDVSKYKFIVFMNSSIRGPHLPAYWPVCCTVCVSHHVACCPFKWKLQAAKVYTSCVADHQLATHANR